MKLSCNIRETGIQTYWYRLLPLSIVQTNFHVLQQFNVKLETDYFWRRKNAQPHGIDLFCLMTVGQIQTHWSHLLKLQVKGHRGNVHVVWFTIWLSQYNLLKLLYPSFYFEICCFLHIPVCCFYFWLNYRKLETFKENLTFDQYFIL